MRFVFWQNFPSIHQSASIRALAERERVSVSVVVEQEIPTWRARMGWGAVDFGHAAVLRVRSASEACDQLRCTPPDAVHVFTSLRSCPTFVGAFREALATGRFAGLMSEPYDPRGVMGAVRFARSCVEGVRIGSRVRFVLAIGHGAVRWYQQTGFAKGIVFPYAYFVEQPSVSVAQTQVRNEPFKLIFVGQCIQRKGLDILLRALALLRDLDWRLTVIGTGPAAPVYEGLASLLGVSSKVDFLGARTQRDTLEAIALSDLLVLPSRFDGWGAVVNESLMLGVPAICTSLCGSADLLAPGAGRGQVVAAGSVGKLAQALQARIALGRPTTGDRARIRDWSASSIGGSAAADYLVRIVESIRGAGSRPVAPWLLPGLVTAEADECIP